MSASSIIIAGFGSNDKVPGGVAQTVYGAGASSLGGSTLYCLLVGLQASTPATGAATVDTEIFPIRTEADAELKGGGAGCEIARMAYKALKVPGVALYGLCPTPAASPTAATATITFGGTWSTAGQYTARVAGDPISMGVRASDTAITAAATLTALVNGNAKLAVTAAQGSSPNDNRVTLTWKSATIRGNDGILFQDKSAVPSGMTATLAGGSSVTGGGIHFSGGAGTEDVTTAALTVANGWYHRLGLAQYDATNLARWESTVDTLADPLTGKPTHAVAATTAALATAQSLGQTTLNNPRCQLLWLLNGESHPVEIAAAFAALRTVTEQQNPNSDYDGAVLRGIVGQSQTLDRPIRSTVQSALDNSVTPLTTNDNGEVVVVRSITTLSRVNSNPYYGTLDTYKAYVPDYVRLRLLARWTGWSAVNRYVRDDPAQGEPDPPANVATPTRWRSEVLDELLNLQTEQQITGVGTDNNTTPVAEYDSTAERIMARVPVRVLPHQHQTGISVEQQAT